LCKVQDALAQPLLLENVSSYVRYLADEMSEWEFIRELVRRTGCELLLDVNNVYVSSVNHGFDPRVFIDAMPAGAVRQIHLAGHEDQGGYLIDTHDQPVCAAVWGLYAHTVSRLGQVPTMIERDDHIPPLELLVAELDKARSLAQHRHWPQESKRHEHARHCRSVSRRRSYSMIPRRACLLPRAYRSRAELRCT
jgi:uncharacterized protein (UPF0276 family)